MVVLGGERFQARALRIPTALLLQATAKKPDATKSATLIKGLAQLVFILICTGLIGYIAINCRTNVTMVLLRTF